ncbi:MAG TPA: VOC family protein [Sphingomicrobium sp.]|jgi:catechol 2,3-dioxygenase-like lactoylglutathione lyase family enzyme|nr:VOC family protein [Sphingomicrobium sp.]
MGVLGIGGLFFRASDPEALTAWYREHLNVGPGCGAPGAGKSDEYSWMASGGPVVFMPFKDDTDYFPAEKAYMLNLRVSDIDGLIERLKDAGIAVETRDEWNDPSIGRFARVHDPEGNPVELWQPPAS